MQENSELFNLFWENSKLTSSNIRQFKERIDEYSGQDHQQKSLLYPGSDLPLLSAGDNLSKIMNQRKSVREFSGREISHQKLGRLFSSLGLGKSGHRTFASAGSTYALEVFAVLTQAEGNLSHKIVYYNSDNHSLTIIGQVENYDSFKSLLNIETESTTPAAIFIFTIHAERTIKKYGERGGRFALIEVGHAAQNLALRLAKEGLVGVELGGLMDDKVAELLGIDKYPLKIVLGYACGFPKK